MKKLIVTFCFLSVFTWLSSAQKFASVDMSYILKNIPAYETANEQINQVSKKWQSEVEALQKEAEAMYKNYQTELVFMTEEMKKKREEEIVAKEKEAQELKRKYFGPQGELFKKRESLMKPIQDEVYTAIQSISKDRNIEVVFDKSTAMSVVFTTPGIDISDEVLKQLGYSK
ncbi:MAG TPA: OmpH family outer membrane protein [Paludibacteraceae bacterium]|jgi:outer membrane protein|nr:OmpH family outer membrane protein [Paludibacteraceae bacterium]OPZ01875.1 MAG: periplasmic chaperone [Bacteroidetes bacterium ADurb.BinA395]MBP8967325.1 OmpH family outer membrane protein [Paludibacteraceae bacterium]HOF99039.1 OmpH family outer membrane protein [Paludibacteraceae bacterium]HOJ65689.1 OmpH family outer membrane protein [Paludibacteraceae bacterium]